MQNDRLWAPWRLAYIQGGEKSESPRPVTLLDGGDAKCFLCRAVADTADRENLVVWRGQHAFAILNRFPYNNGHVLIAPRRHVGRLDEVDSETHAESIAAMNQLIAVIERTMNADGFNVGLNLGKVAGAGVPGHLHWHIVPRWNGDTNFMPVLGETKVISQSLDALWDTLAPALRST